MPDTLVTSEFPDASLAIVTLNRPEKRNALNLALIGQLTAAIREAQSDQYRRAVILCGAGKSFCAGLDLAEVGMEGNAERSARALAELYLTIATSPCVTIAVAQGAAMGGGVGILAAADIAIAADDLQLGFPEVKRGLVAALITALIRRSVGDRALRELVLLGQVVDAKRAREIGLVNAVVKSGQLLLEARSIASQINQTAPNAIVRSKSLLDELATRQVAHDLDVALRYHLEARHGGEAKEGIAAFLEKRPPNWGPRD